MGDRIRLARVEMIGTTSSVQVEVVPLKNRRATPTQNERRFLGGAASTWIYITILNPSTRARRMLSQTPQPSNPRFEFAINVNMVDFSTESSTSASMRATAWLVFSSER